MNPEELMKRLEDHVNYLRRNVAPDDIYLFAEQNRLAAMFFLKKWAEECDVGLECLLCRKTRAWVERLILLDLYMENDEDKKIDVGFTFQD